ncbi:MAG: ROK family glucokinase [Bacillota bacterium]|nr:ROK family glucokinase [Bacillota bacterium]
MSQYVFGVDIGGTTVKLGFFDVEGNLLDKWEIPTRTEGEGSQILPDIAASIQKKIEEKKIAPETVAGVGVGAPGPVDGEGVIHKAVNLGWGIFSIKETLEEIIHMPVMAGNDANVAALGEMWRGGGQGYHDLIVVTLGTGVGGGIIVGGKVLTGSTGAGGEIGHIHVEDHETEACGCGNKGCLEQFTSATGITRLANRKLKASDANSILREGEVSAKTVFDAVKAKDTLAMEVAQEFGKYLGNGLASIACVVNPEAIVIGGGVSKAGEILIDYIKPYYEKNVFHGSRNVKFALATLGNDAGIYGAAKLVLDAEK